VIEQLQFPFASLDFPGRSSLYPHEIAARLGICVDQVYDLCDDGSLVGINVGSQSASRRSLRIPIEAYRNFIVARMTGPLRLDLLRHLPRATLRDLVRELQEILRSSVTA
jgi:hypothetical protein